MVTAGIAAISATITILNILLPTRFSTILKVDYNTRHRYFVGNDAHLFGAESLRKRTKE